MTTMHRVLTSACCLAITWVSVTAVGQISSQLNDAGSCRHFAQDFYSWYVPFTQKRLGRPAFELAIQRKTAVFAPELLRGLQLDSEAQQRAKGEIVGIDFDPFVGSQDPADHYNLRKATVKGNKCLIEVWRNSPNDTSAKSANPNVIAELSHRGGRWQFDNFRYPDLNSDLLSELASLRKARGQQR